MNSGTHQNTEKQLIHFHATRRRIERERERRESTSVRFQTLATKTILVNNTANASVIFFFVHLWDIDNKSVTNIQKFGPKKKNRKRYMQKLLQPERKVYIKDSPP